jgi:hypothetical protein
MCLTSYGYVSQIERLGIYVTVQWDGEQLAELAAVPGERPNRLGGVLASPSAIVVIGCDIHLRGAEYSHAAKRRERSYPLALQQGHGSHFLSPLTRMKNQGFGGAGWAFIAFTTKRQAKSA